MMVWKMTFLFQGCILRFHVNLPGCTCNLYVLNLHGFPLLPCQQCWKPRLLHLVSAIHRIQNILQKIHWNNEVFPQLHPWKLTWHWKITIFNRKYIFKWRISHCHVSFRGCNAPKTRKFPIKVWRMIDLFSWKRINSTDFTRVVFFLLPPQPKWYKLGVIDGYEYQLLDPPWIWFSTHRWCFICLRLDSDPNWCLFPFRNSAEAFSFRKHPTPLRKKATPNIIRMCIYQIHIMNTYIRSMDQASPGVSHTRWCSTSSQELYFAKTDIQKLILNQPT